MELVMMEVAMMELVVMELAMMELVMMGKMVKFLNSLTKVVMMDDLSFWR